MKHQLVSEIFFEETLAVASADTAQSLFGRLLGDVDLSHAYAESAATCWLMAVIEAACIREMRRCIDPTKETVVGRRVDIDHRQPVASGATVRLSGWVERIGARSGSFLVRALEGAQVVCEARVVLVAVETTSLAARMARRASALERSYAYPVPQTGADRPHSTK